jgi:predicted ATPase/class 3 adenylate cyclase
VTVSTRTLLFSDIEGSTPLLERAGTSYPALLSEHRRIVRAAVHRAGGIEHSTEGDSFFLTFDSPTAAVAAAVEAQLALESHSWPDGLRLRVRMGMHIGEVLEDDGDLVGMSIHHAARIVSTAHGGQIVLSGAVHDMVRTLPRDVTLRALGAHQLRDAGTVELFQADHPNLQRDFPPPRGVITKRTNLPRSLTTFIGGAALLRSVSEQFDVSSLVTLTGTGGVGKTRTALEYAWEHLENHHDGVFFIDLSPITESDAIASAIIDVLPFVHGSGSSPLASLTDWIAERALLLVIDNCEHLVADVATAMDSMIVRCPRLKVLATSREALGVGGERVVRVPSLDVADAVELFLQRALAADPTFQLEGHREAVMQICTRLDGIPLAIELAAARIRSLTPTELVDRLEDRFRLLRGSGRGTLDRHHTLRAMVTWSYQLLGIDERTMLDRLSVFAGGFDLAAAEEVCAGGPIDREDVIDLLSSLVDKSMVVATRGAAGTRYRLLETIRQFGEEHLDVAGAAADLRDRHARHIAGLAADLDAMVMSRDELEGTRRMDEEWDNLRAAHQWAIAQRDLDMAERLAAAGFNYADLRLRYEHGVLMERTVELGESLGRPSSDMIGRLCHWRVLQGEEEETMRLARRGLEVAPDPEHWTTAMCWFEFAGASPLTTTGSDDVRHAFERMKAAVKNHPHIDRDWLVSVELVDASLWAAPQQTNTLRQGLDELAARVQAPRLITFSLMYEGHGKILDGPEPDFAAALPFYRRALETARSTNDLQHVGVALRATAMAATGMGRADARRFCHEALSTLYDTRYWQKLWQAMDSAVLALAESGLTQEAVTILGHLDAHMPAYGIEMTLGFRARVRRHLDDPAHQTLAKDGARMSAEQTVLAAIGWCADSSEKARNPNPDGGSGLADVSRHHTGGAEGN